mmetsp:Transcript_3684/g.6831  ORF Transcript_3684/g.6831 Transcript_3684/m.6831 type:complete len:248 (+) Transcript_3684:287-1030(+)
MNLNTSKKFQNLNLNLNLFIRRPHIAIKNDNAINNSKKCSVKFKFLTVHTKQRKTIMMEDPKKGKKTTSTKTSTLHVSVYAYIKKWCMGEPLHMTFDIETATIKTISEHISQIKNKIDQSTMNFFISSTDRHIPREKWDLNLRENGIYDQAVLRLEPISEDVEWEWHDMEYYVTLFLSQVTEALPLEVGMPLDKLKEAAPLPPPMAKKYAYLPFLRKYPDLFYIEVNTKVSYVHVERNIHKKVPMWF